jgi:hypothetical protein
MARRRLQPHSGDVGGSRRGRRDDHGNAPSEWYGLTYVYVTNIYGMSEPAWFISD